MNEEYCSLMANDTWDLVPLPKDRTKYGVDGSVDKHKA